MRSKQTATILKLVEKEGILRPRDLDKYNLSREVLRRMAQKGLLQRLARGLYVLPDRQAVTEHHSLAEACKRIPHGVICLLSSLHFHGLTTQVPSEVWMAIDNKKRLPRKNGPSMRFVYFSGNVLNLGVEEHTIEGVTVRIYNPAKTVADCFKYRNKIGLDVAIEALKDCWNQNRCTMDDLWYYAKKCRVSVVMKPYMESLI